MNIQQVLAEIRKNKLAPVYLITGNERYLADTFKKELLQQVLNGAGDEFNLSTFDMEETPLSIAVEEASSVPFFGDYRIVFIERPYFLTAEKKAIEMDHQVEELLQYLAHPSPTTILVIFALYEKLDERKKVVKQLKKETQVVDVHAMKEAELKSYCQQYIQSEGYTITTEAFEQLLRLTDMELTKVMGEMAKLFLYTADSKKITKEDVRGLVPKSLEHNIFDMVTYVLKGQTESALSLYQDLLLQGEETIKLNAVLVSQFRLLVQVKMLGGLGYQQKNIADVLKIHPYRVKLAMQQCKQFSLDALGTTLDELVENEYKMKTGKMDKELLFELFLLKEKS
ncbi:DNA polymerase III subunit delta [Vagococcus entomophilus]|uniref:DNA polymerase III subunit delta n=1 Tax=Vagococcus entomophilus TaxID=1160095 RepID=A0A430AFG3_9ENTE|nr:DNA polymerase III subunit delta [Vagococcus entomophilus]RSU06483.1 DNA polymerase III subunit delta [Vagococcus entomophilus]